MSVKRITSQRKLEINRLKKMAISAGSGSVQRAGNKPVFKLITPMESSALSASRCSPAAPQPLLLIRDLRGEKGSLVRLWGVLVMAGWRGDVRGF